MDSCIPSSVGDARSTQNVNKEIYSSGSLVYGAKLALKPKVIKLITLTQLSEVSGLPRGRHQLLKVIWRGENPMFPGKLMGIT